MPNVIEFLEKVGQDAKLRHSTSADLEQELKRTEIEPALKEALLSGEQLRLNALLGGRSKVYCLVRLPDDDDEDMSTQFRSQQIAGCR